MSTSTDPNYKQQITCTLCSKAELTHWNETVNARLVKNQVCFSCDFWLDHAARNTTYPDNMRCVITQHSKGRIHQLISPQPSQGAVQPMFLGFGGSQFKIIFTDGRPERLVIANNLWHQGDIPAHFNSKFPVNSSILAHSEKLEDYKLSPDEPIWELRLIGGALAKYLTIQPKG